VDYVLSQGVRCVSVLDISGAALRRAQERLGESGQRVNWIEADVTRAWPVPRVDIWHDRAVFHFLTEDSSRREYRTRLQQAVPRGGSVIIATFALDGPEKCSGLPVIRYSPESLEMELGCGFRLMEAVRESHGTPFGTTQEFWYSRFRVSG
jgi:hypothetical protein